jgi:signal peptidase I
MTTNKPKRRSAWLAALLSLFQPGLGQLYCGRWRAAGVFYSLVALWLLATIALVSASSPRWFTVGWLLGLSAMLLIPVAAIEAAIGARRMREFRPTWYARWYVCLVVFVVAAACASLYSGMLRGRVASLNVRSSSMAPALIVGDYFVAQLARPGGTEIKPCDVVVFRDPRSQAPGADWVKRVVAKAGDRVGYTYGRLRLNGMIVPRKQVGTDGHMTIYRETLPSGCSYLIREWDDNEPLDNIEESTVPPNSFYVLGDDRDDSMDSRTVKFGPVPDANYLGRAVVIYWSTDARRIGNML